MKRHVAERAQKARIVVELGLGERVREPLSFGWARNKGRPAAVPTKLQPYHDIASGADSTSSRAFAIDCHASGVSLCTRRGIG